MTPEQRARFSNIETRPKPILAQKYWLIWEWFTELSEARAAGFDGIAPITFLDIAAWSQLTDTLPTPSEIRLILRTDRAFCAELRRLWKLKQPSS